MAGRGELVGRSSELDLVHGFLAHLDRDGAALLLTGQAGVGKTALLHATKALAVDSGIAVHAVTPSEFDKADRFTSLRRLLRQLRREITALPESAGSALSVALGLREGPPARREVLGAATLTLLQRAAAAKPLLLVLDDVNWLDPASAEVIAFVARRLRGSRIGVLGAVRSGTVGPLMLAGLPERELQPLAPTDAEALLVSRYPQLAAPVRARIVDEADGLPLALLEMPRALTSAQRRGDDHLPAPLPVAERLQRVFGDRIRGLSAITQTQLLLAALQGAAGELGIIKEACPQDPELHGLAEAEAVALIHVRDWPPRVEFAHPLARATVVHQSTADDRRAAHQALAAAYPLDSGAHAWHLADAAAGPDETVAGLLEDHAARTIALGDVAGAMAALQRAAELSPDRTSRAAREIRAAFIGADVTGDLQRAAELLQNAGQIEPTLTDSLAATVSASYILLNGQCDLDAAHSLLVRAIESHPGRADPADPHLNDALHLLLIMSWFGGRPSLWDPFERAIGRFGVGVPRDLQICYQMFGDPVRFAAQALPGLDTTLEELIGELDPIRITRLALAGVYTDRLEHARLALWRVINDGRRGGAVALAINALVSSCVDDWLTGQWDEALELAAEGSRLSDTHGYRRYSVILGGYIDQLIRICRGNVDEGAVIADDMAQWAADRGAGICSVFALHLRTLRAVAMEDFESAYTHVTTACPPGDLRPYSPHTLWTLFDVVESAVKTGRLTAARQHVAAMRDAGVEHISPRLAMVSLGCAAAVADSDDESVALFKAALAVPSAARWPFDRARIQLSLGERLRQGRRTIEAREELRDVLVRFEQLGAQPWARRAERELRAAGEVAPTPNGAWAGVVALTPQEQQVAQLAASGMTNREIGEQLFMSHRSVGAILYRLFPKLGVTSRAALRGALDARRREEDDA